MNIQAFLGWCLVLNIGILLLSTVFLGVLGGWASKLHAQIFNIDETWVRQMYFSYLAIYKIMVIVFNLVPWIAVSLLGS